MKIRHNMLETIPLEIILLIFENLDNKNIMSMRLINKNFNEIVIKYFINKMTFDLKKMSLKISFPYDKIKRGKINLYNLKDAKNFDKFYFDHLEIKFIGPKIKKCNFIDIPKLKSKIVNFIGSKITINDILNLDFPVIKFKQIDCITELHIQEECAISNLPPELKILNAPKCLIDYFKILKHKNLEKVCIKDIDFDGDDKITMNFCLTDLMINKQSEPVRLIDLILFKKLRTLKININKSIQILYNWNHNELLQNLSKTLESLTINNELIYHYKINS